MNARTSADRTTSSAVEALRAHPDFHAAMRHSAFRIISLYRGHRLVNWLVDDRGQLVFAYLTLYLHFTASPEDPASGLTPTRMKKLCQQYDVCSPGRAEAMLSLMRFGGYVASAASGPDRRRRRLLATDKLLKVLVERLRLHFSAIGPIFPEARSALAAFEDEDFLRRLILAMHARLEPKYRDLTKASGLDLFSERSAGMLILANLLASADENRTASLSVSALARRFGVSRPHVLKLLRDAEAESFIGMTERDGQREVVLLPRFIDAAERGIAAIYLYFADCAREALDRPPA